MTQIQQMSDLMIKQIVKGYLNGELTITKPVKPLEGKKDGSIMEQVFFEFEKRKL